MFIEVNVGTNAEMLVNFETVHRVSPAVSGNGSILYFQDGKTQNVSEKYEVIKKVLIKPVTVEVKEESKPAPVKKEAEKVKS